MGSVLQEHLCELNTFKARKKDNIFHINDS